MKSERQGENMKKILLLALMLLFVIGCSPSNTEQKNTETPDPLAGGPNKLELVIYAQTAMENFLKVKIEPVYTIDDNYEVTKTLLRYVIIGPYKIDGVKRDVIVKLEFEDDKYEYYKIFQLKIDGKNT